MVLMHAPLPSGPFCPEAPATRPRGSALLGIAALLFVSCARAEAPGPLNLKERNVSRAPGTARIIFLHHSTGKIIWKGGLPQFIRSWNAAHGTHYEISEMAYPGGTGGHARSSRLLPGRLFNKLVSDRYPWNNYPYDYWNLWVAHTGERRDRAEWNLDDLARSYDVIVFKHCFPVSRIERDDGAPSVSSSKQTVANYRLQYEALKTRMHQFPRTTFIVWTGAALTQASSNPEDAARARQFATWVKETWDERGDNLFVWDFRDLETEGGLFLQPGNAYKPKDSHPTGAFAAKVAPLLGRRIVDVIEGRGDQSSLTGR